MKKRRYPRLVLDSKARATERILHIVYNKLRRSRGSLKFRNFDYDVYTAKRSWNAKVKFMLLAEKLVQQNIDPALYIKIMCRYGKFKNSRYMPHPTWLAKDGTIEKFLWVYRREKKSYGLHLDFKKSIDGWSDLDIYSSIRDSGRMVKVALESSGMTVQGALAVFEKEISPWWKVMYNLVCDKDYRLVEEFLKRHRHVRRLAKKAFLKDFSRL